MVSAPRTIILSKFFAAEFLPTSKSLSWKSASFASVTIESNHCFDLTSCSSALFWQAALPVQALVVQTKKFSVQNAKKYENVENAETVGNFVSVGSVEGVEKLVNHEELQCEANSEVNLVVDQSWAALLLSPGQPCCSVPGSPAAQSRAALLLSAGQPCCSVLGSPAAQS